MAARPERRARTHLLHGRRFRKLGTGIRTRLISAFLGGQGAGKSTAQRLTGRLLVGPRFEASDVCADREDAFIAAITNKVVYAIAGC
jgi:ABC-type enterochelin transport system ATPase subunit